MRLLIVLAAGMIMSLATTASRAATLEIFHADSLAGPMRALKSTFEAKNPGVDINLTSGTSKQLAERIVAGARCDVFASSSPAVIEQDLMKAATGAPAASWFVVFSANEMVVIAQKGNPRKIARMSDLAAPDLRFARVTGDKDLATQRTIDFIARSAAREGAADLAQRIVGKAPADPAHAVPVPGVVEAVTSGAANAGIVYLSAAIAAADAVSVIRFPAEVNLSEGIRNAATVPAAAKEQAIGEAFVKFLLSAEGRGILERTGQPPLTPPTFVGATPSAFR